MVGGWYDFERLEVSRKAMDFAERTFELTERLPSMMQYSLGDQLRRATLSICNNIAEGSQKRGAARRQFYGYALGSSRECVPMLELARRRNLLSGDLHEELADECFQIGNRLYCMMVKT